jgi:hypothetical protein
MIPAMTWRCNYLLAVPFHCLMKGLQEDEAFSVKLLEVTPTASPALAFVVMLF